MSRSVSNSYRSAVNPVPIMLALLLITLVFGGIVIYDDTPTRAGAVINQRVACPSPGALLATIKTAIATQSNHKTFLVAAGGGCTMVAPGDRVRVVQYGGLFWWRVQVEKEGRLYWTPRDAI